MLLEDQDVTACASGIGCVVACPAEGLRRLWRPPLSKALTEREAHGRFAIDATLERERRPFADVSNRQTT